MPEFSLDTVWKIPAPLDRVWACLIDTASWPVWWPYVAAVEELAANDRSGIDDSRRYQWLTCLPYKLSLDIRLTRYEPCCLIDVEVSGDLKGYGSCRLAAEPSTSITVVCFKWNVRTCKPWMKRLSPLLRPVFIWNHNRVMQQGETGLIKYLNSQH